jgi:uncharacterized membrane protein YphA (DoxX/SURF4 family)
VCSSRLALAAIVLFASSARAQCDEDGFDCESFESARASLGGSTDLWRVSAPRTALTNPRVLEARDHGFVAAGATLFSIGSGAALVTAVLDHVNRPCTSSESPWGGSPTACDSAALSWVPIAGGIVTSAGTLNGRRSSYGWLIAGIPSAILQLIGGAMFLVGMFTTHVELRPSAILLPYADPTGGGLTFATEI